MWFALLAALVITTNMDYNSKEPIDCAIEIITENQKFILNKIDEWQKGKPMVLMDKYRKERLEKIILNVTVIKDNAGKKKFVQEYLDELNTFAYMIGGTVLITDSINIKFLSNLLRTDDFKNKAWQELYEQTSFDALKSNGNYISTIIKRNSDTPDGRSELLALTSTKKIELDSIKKLEYPFARANAGDSVALDSFITIYKKQKQNNDKTLYASILMATGQMVAVRAALEDFCLPIYNIEKRKGNSPPCTTSTYQREIIKELRRYHPKDTLINNYIEPFLNENIYTPGAQEKTMERWEKLRTWVGTNYQVKLDTKPPFMNIFRSCGPYF